jgi:hypothetical protein
MPRAPEKPRADLLLEIANLPDTAFISPQLAAAYINTTTSVMLCWREQRRGPRYHGANAFIRYKVADLDAWMATRANEIIEKPEGLFPAAPRLVWQCDQSTDPADHFELETK